MSHEFVWAFVVLVVVGLAYDIARRAIGNVKRSEVEALMERLDRLRDGLELRGQDHGKLRGDYDEHVKLCNEIFGQWRQKVGELESKVDRVTIDAKNELAGTLASVGDATRKGWR